MNRFKKSFLFGLLIVLTLFLVACNTSTPSDNPDTPDTPDIPDTPGDNPDDGTEKYTVTFVDVDGTVLKTEEVDSGAAATAPSNPSKEGLEFIKWDTEFDEVTSDLTVKPVYFGIQETTQLKMDFDFQGKEFQKDGIGEVRLNRVVDGDTISVYSGSYQSITIRFLGIDTPESTGTIQPWGKASSAYAKEVLYSAHSIVLEAEGSERMDSNGKRWLAWVWYKPTADSEYRLFNLEEIELAYAKYSQKVDSKYHDVMKRAHDTAKATAKRVWGEKDPNFAYLKEEIETTLLDLWYNHENFKTGSYFYVTVRLIRTVGNNMYLEDAEEQTLELEDGTIINGKGSFYAFYGYKANYYRMYNIGDVFKIRCQLEWDSDYGTQLTGLSKDLFISESAEAPEITVLDANELGYSMREVKDAQGNLVQAKTSDLIDYMCQVVTVNNLKCESVKLKGSGDDQYYTAVMTNNKGDKFDVYFSNNLITKWNADKVLEVGKTYSITGGIAYYSYANGYYQIVVGDAPRYNNGKLNELDVFRLNDIVEIK